MATRSNEDWLRALKQAGEAQEEALEELRDYLFRVVLVYLRDRRSLLSGFSSAEIRQLAEDLAQEALLSIRTHLDSFRGESKFTTWAYRFAINQAASELRLARYSYFSLERLPEQASAALLAVLRDKETLDPEQATAQRNLLQLLEDIISTELSERQRQAILGVHLQGRSMSEVAERLDITPNALYKLLYDARKKIKAQLQARRLSENDILALFE